MTAIHGIFMEVAQRRHADDAESVYLSSWKIT